MKKAKANQMFSMNGINNGEMFAWEGLTCIRIDSNHCAIHNERDNYVVGKIYTNCISIEDPTEYDSVFRLMDVIEYGWRAYLDNVPECPMCGHKLAHDKAKTEAAAAASRENGKKGGRPRKSVQKYTDFEIGQGANDGTIFQISKEGGVWRRKPDSVDAYGLYGHVRPDLNTPVQLKKLLGILRTARAGNHFSKSTAANVKQTVEIIKKFNEE